MPISPARRAAFEILRRIEDENAYSSALLATAEDLNAKDRGLLHELVLGVLRQRLWLDRCIEHFGARRIAKLDPAVLLALRLGLYQLRFLSRIPASAAVNDSVNLVRAAKLKSAAAFVNAVLRRAARETEYDPLTGVDDPLEKLALETSHPLWLVERWQRQMGFDETAALARANNHPARVAFRFTTKAREKAAAIIKDLRELSAGLRKSAIAPNGWRVSRDVTESESEAEDTGDRRNLSALLRQLSGEGLIYFQDEGSQLVAELVGAQNGERVLDVCAAPGSKATLMANVAPEAMIVAGDLYAHRARTIQKFAAQQHTENVQTLVYDATMTFPFTDGSFDRVLVDAPCSGTGTLRHNPEIRWRLSAADITELAAKQQKILRNAARMVRPNGVLLYSTCSLEIEENEQVVNDFRNHAAGFKPLALEASKSLLTDGQILRTWPQRDDVDGFFVAAFGRRS